MICDLNPKHAEKKASLFYFCTLYHISLGSLGRRIFTMKSPSYFSQNGLKMAAFLQIRCCHATNLHHPFTFPTEKAGSPKLFAASFPGACPKQQHGPCRFHCGLHVWQSLQAVARTKRSEKQSLFFSMATQTPLLEKKETVCEILLNWIELIYLIDIHEQFDKYHILRIVTTRRSRLGFQWWDRLMGGEYLSWAAII